MTRKLLLVAPLLVAPLFSQVIPAAADPVANGSRFEWFQLNESPAQIRQALGKPSVVADFGADFQSWQFQIGDIDHHDFSHQVVFRKSTRSLVSVTRNYEPEVPVDKLFPPRETTVHYFPNADKPAMSFRVRLLSHDRVLIATGSVRPGQTTNQILLIHRNELRFFYDWLANQLAGSPIQPHTRQP